MRCPKCGYISFDRQKSCGRCSNDLTAVAEQFQGTVGKNAAPFFLGAVLGEERPVVAEPPAAFREEEEPLVLHEVEPQALPVEEEDLDFAGPPLDEDDLEEQALPSLDLEGIDVSDLMSAEEEEPELSLESEEEEAPLATAPAPEEHSLMGDIELPSLTPDEALTLDEPESLLAGLQDEAAETSAEAGDEDIIDLSSLMGFEEAPAKSAASEEHDLFDLSSSEEEDELDLLSLEDSEKATAPAKAAKKPAGAGIPDLGLTLEKDDK